jgi:predicted HicB family RNase H-like nuclease
MRLTERGSWKVTDHYTYRLSWSPEDEEYVATCAEFPSLSWLAEDEVTALRGLKDLVRDTVKEMQESGERIPEPLAERTYSGTLSLRVPPALHRRLAIEAAESHVSLSRHLNCKLASA